MQQRRKAKRSSIDRLRARVWFEVVVCLSGGMSKQQLWKDIGFSRSAWFNYPKGAVPTMRIVNAVENKYPETQQILNANFWRILQGKEVSTLEIQKEFAYFNSHFTANYPILDLEFWSENSAIDFSQLLMRIVQVIDTDDDRGMHLQVIISLLSMVRDTNLEIWNELCRLYRAFLPDFVTQIHWPFKAEVFDAVDGYVRLRERKGISTIEDPSDDWSWRDRRLEIVSVLDEHYENNLYAYFHENKISSMSAPKTLIDDISSILSFKVCTTEKLMFHSWNLWEPAGILLMKMLNKRMIDIRSLTAEVFVTCLEQVDFFNPYEQELLNYEYFMHVARNAELHLNFDFNADTAEISFREKF
jgi:hypothetical protein